MNTIPYWDLKAHYTRYQNGLVVWVNRQTQQIVHSRPMTEWEKCDADLRAKSEAFASWAEVPV